MRLILARHGNTFAPGEKVYCVGAQNDLPLVREGFAQAEQLGQALTDGINLEAIYHAPLHRTTQFAQAAATSAGIAVPILADDRLTELDFGQWSGLTDEEIASKFGDECLSDWNDKCIWPKDCGWANNPAFIEQQIQAFLSDLKTLHPPNSTVLAVTSNGRLRYFLKLDESEFEHRLKNRSFKVSTGRVCLLNVQMEGMSVGFWNEEPRVLADRLTV